MSKYCALLTSQWKESLRSTSVPVGDTRSLKCSIARVESQNIKFAPILIITEAKNAHFFVCKRTGFVHQRLRDFVKMTLTRVSDCDSGRVESFCENVSRPFLSTWLESSQRHQKSWLESSRVIDLSHAITAKILQPESTSNPSSYLSWGKSTVGAILL